MAFFLPSGSMVKRFTSIFILTLLLVHLVGFYAYFAIRLGEVRLEMRMKLADLPDESLEVIVIPKHSFKSEWLDEREMKWQDRMYDIARVEEAGANLRVFCLHDEDEDGLLNFLASVVETSQEDNRRAPDSVIQFFALKYVSPQVMISTRQEKTLSIAATPYQISFNPFIPDPLSPPPRS